MLELPAWLLSALRTAIQAGWGWAVAHVYILAFIPEDAVVSWIMTVLVIGGATALLRWLESRKGDGLWSRLARGLARLLMLGLTGRQPVYASPDAVVRVDGRQVQ